MTKSVPGPAVSCNPGPGVLEKPATGLTRDARQRGNLALTAPLPRTHLRLPSRGWRGPGRDAEALPAPPRPPARLPSQGALGMTPVACHLGAPSYIFLKSGFPGPASRAWASGGRAVTSQGTGEIK